ncbi:MAG: YlbF family regulator [Spirochaetota bacterium]|nr:YlbF family regulator [Spirochaetota bacterium]
MEEILETANKLGLMIKGTELYERFEELSKKLESDKESKDLLEEFAKISEEMNVKEQSGSTIEVEEKKKINDITEKVSKNQLLKEFIATQSYYMNMMMQIQKAISQPKGEPIRKSKIIKPDSSGKIITDI